MDVKFNVKKFSNVMMKATLNYSIDYLQLKFQEGKIKSGMVSDQRSIVTVIDVDNDVLELTPQDDIVFNFSQPTTLLPFLDILIMRQEETASMKIDEDEKIVLLGEHGGKSSIHFCNESTLKRNILHKTSKEDFPYFHWIEVTDDLINHFEPIKKIGPRFGKIYINVKNGVLSIETCDRLNAFSDGHDEPLAKNIDIEDLSICFDFKNFMSLMTVVENVREYEEKSFKMGFAYIREREGGMIHTISKDESEQYFLLNRES